VLDGLDHRRHPNLRLSSPDRVRVGFGTSSAGAGLTKGIVMSCIRWGHARGRRSDALAGRRLARLGITAVLVVITTGLGAGLPAHGAPSFAQAPTVQVGYTDSAQPRTAFDQVELVDLPLGTRVDGSGTAHTSRVYATFDIGAYQGVHLLSARVSVRESQVADCGKRSVEVWQTRTVTVTPTWHDAPAELVRLAEAPPSTVCPGTLSFAVTSAIQQALDRHQNRVTFELRLPAAVEADPSYFRFLSWFSGVALTIGLNHVPTVQVNSLVNAGRDCGVRARPPVVGAFADTLQAIAIDADPNDRSMSLRFALWPSNDPASVTEFTANTQSGSYGTGHAPAGVLVDGLTYAWRVQATDGLDTSAWSKTCYFTYDGTRPAAPTITSSNYPNNASGPVGEQARFTFSSGGDPDVAGFIYLFGSDLEVGGCPIIDGRLVCADPLSHPNTVRPEEPGDAVQVRLNPPDVGLGLLTVIAVDRAGNPSPAAHYQFIAPDSTPVLTAVPASPQWNESVTISFRPHPGVRGVTSYVYTIDAGSPQTLAAGPDGGASITFTITNPDGVQVRVRSVSGNGFISPPARFDRVFFQGPGVFSDLYLDDGNPHGGIGVTGTFTFTPPPGWLDVTEYFYLAPDAADFVAVPAGPDGRATITFAPQSSGSQSITVEVLDPSGNPSFNTYSFVVA